jgi:hypothetical protein
MDNITRTIYGSMVQTALLLGRPVTYPANSTLNEKLDINKNTTPSASEKPVLGYFCIGNKGHKITMGGENVAAPEPIPHAATDAALFGQIPFVLRPLNNDLSTTARARFALRRVEVHDSVSYAAYYLRRIDLSAVTPQMIYATVANGTTTETAFVPSAANLNPTQPQVDSQGQWIVSGDYVVAKAILGLLMTEDDINELLNVAMVMYSTQKYAIISEIGLCTGVDKLVSVSQAGGNFNMMEAIGVQIASHIPTFYSAVSNNRNLSIDMNVGATEPMWNVVSG